GWAYLTVGLLVLVLGWRREWLMGALALLLLAHLTFNHGGPFGRLDTKPWLGAAAGPLAALAHGVDEVGRYGRLRAAPGPVAAGGSAPLRAGGANPLVAYFLHPIVVEAVSLAGLGGTLLAYKGSSDPWVVVGGSLAMAALVCAAAGLLGRLGLRMRL